MRTIILIVRLLLFIYFALKLAIGDKNKIETLWYGIWAIILII